MASLQDDFEALLKGLNKICLLGHDHWAIWRQMWDMQATHLTQANYSPAFFQVTMLAHFNCFVLEMGKLYDRRFKDTVCLLRYVYFVQNNLSLFDATEYNCDIKSDLVFDEINISDSYSIVQNIYAWRDKVIAHFDPEYLEDGRHPLTEFPVEVGEIERLFRQGGEILNRYSVYYNGRTSGMSSGNIDDLNVLMRYAKRGKKAIREDRDAEWQRLRDRLRKPVNWRYF